MTPLADILKTLGELTEPKKGSHGSSGEEGVQATSSLSSKELLKGTCSQKSGRWWMHEGLDVIPVRD